MWEKYEEGGDDEHDEDKNDDPRKRKHERNKIYNNKMS
jgi:hypothetical protein